MTTSTQPAQLQSGTPAPQKSVWKKFNDPNVYPTATTTTHTLINGSADEAHEKDSVSSKDVAHEDVIHGEGSEGHSTPASSMTDEAAQIHSPLPPKATPVYSAPSITDEPAQVKPSQPPKPGPTRRLSPKLASSTSQEPAQIRSPQPSKPTYGNRPPWASVSSKEVPHAEGSSQGHLVPSSSTADETRRSTSPRPRKPAHRQNSSPQPQQPASVSRPSWGSGPPKDVAKGGSSSQGHSTPPSSITDEAVEITPEQPPAPPPVYKPAPLPTVNPWKVREEELARKRWKESQNTPPVPIHMDRVVPPPPTNPPAKSSNKPNGVVKPEVKAPTRRSTKNNNVIPPALEDSKAWPPPDVAAAVEKEDRGKSTAPLPPAKEIAKEVANESGKEHDKEDPKDLGGESREPKEPRESKKKKWEKIEVNFQYDSPQNRRGRGGKFNRNPRGSGRDSVARTKDGANEKEERSRNVPKSDGEDTVVSPARDTAPVERRAPNPGFEPGHRHRDEVPSEWTMQSPFTQEPSPMNTENWRASSPSRSDHQARQSHVDHDVSAQQSRSRGSSRGKNSSPSGSKQPIDQHHSPVSSPNGQTQFPDLPQWDEQEHNAAPQNNPQFNQQANQTRRGNGRTFRGRNSYSSNAYPQNQYMPPPPPPQPQQMPFQGFYPTLYSQPMQTGFPVNRSHSVPYFSPNSMSRYPQPAYPPQFYPDYSRLGVQPGPMPLVDEEMKQRIVRQVEYYFSSENLFKDTFLRKKMDTMGFVALQVLVQFNRLQVITSDVPTVLQALLSSTELEVLSSSERGPLVRARHDPTKWVYPLNERDESAKHAGPSAFYFQAHQETLRQMQEYQQYQYPQTFFLDSQYGFPASSFRPPEHDISTPFVNEPDLHSPVSPHLDPQNRKLSGEASIFVPNGVNYVPPMMNGDQGAYDLQSMRNAIPTVTEEPDELVDIFEEENLSNILVIVTDPKDKPIVPALPMNGVKHQSEEAHRSPTLPVTWRFPDTAATQASTSHSVKTVSSNVAAQDDQPTRSRTSENELTERNLKKQLSQSGITESSYPEFRSKAIQSRQKSNRDSTQMIHLYQFWSDFLCDYWVPGMYSEFMHFAVEDANASRRYGLLTLFSMYERVLNVKFRTTLWNDFIRLAGEDYRNGHLAGIESVWRIRGRISAKGRNVTIRDGDVSRLVDVELQHPTDLDRLRKEVKPPGVVLVPYTTVRSLLKNV